MEIYFLNIRIQSEYRKTGTRKNSVFGHVLAVIDISSYLKHHGEE